MEEKSGRRVADVTFASSSDEGGAAADDESEKQSLMHDISRLKSQLTAVNDSHSREIRDLEARYQTDTLIIISSLIISSHLF